MKKMDESSRENSLPRGFLVNPYLFGYDDEDNPIWTLSPREVERLVGKGMDVNDDGTIRLSRLTRARHWIIWHLISDQQKMNDCGWYEGFDEAGDFGWQYRGPDGDTSDPLQQFRMAVVLDEEGNHVRRVPMEGEPTYYRMPNGRLVQNGVDPGFAKYDIRLPPPSD